MHLGKAVKIDMHTKNKPTLGAWCLSLEPCLRRKEGTLDAPGQAASRASQSARLSPSQFAVSPAQVCSSKVSHSFYSLLSHSLLITFS